MDSATFKTYASFIVKEISETDAVTGEIAQKYVDALVAEREGKGTKEAAIAILDHFPQASQCSGPMVSLISSLFQLTATAGF